MNLVVDHVARHDRVDRGDVRDGAGTDITLAHFDDPQLVPFQLEVCAAVIVVAFRGRYTARLQGA